MQLLYIKLIKIKYKCSLLFPTSANRITLKNLKTTQDIIRGNGIFRHQVFLP